MRQTRRNVEIKGRVGELTYEASKMSSGSPERSGTGRHEDFTYNDGQKITKPPRTPAASTATILMIGHTVLY